MVADTVSLETQKRIDLLFPLESRPQVVEALKEFTSILRPMSLDAMQQERWHFAALKLSSGNLEKLGDAMKLARTDWRDLLVAAGFGAVDSHRAWLSANVAR